MRKLVKVPTRTKLQIAGVLSAFFKFAFRAVGSDPSRINCHRRGMNWELDLNEGIHLSIFLFGRFERDTTSLLKRLVRPNMVVLDIGANIGAHTLPIAQLVGAAGKVVAIEPTEWAFSYLQKHLELNPIYAARVIAKQVGFIRKGGAKPESLVASWDLTKFRESDFIQGGTAVSTRGARFLTLDEFTEEMQLTKIDLIKIDVDGYEGEILSGARETLSKARPPIIIEFSPIALKENQTSAENLFQIIQSLQYDVFSIDGKGPLSLDQVLDLVPENGGINFLALHKESVHLNHRKI